MSNKEPVVALVGASGLVGAEILNLLEERNFPFSDLKLLASKDSVGDQVSVAGEEYEIYELNEDSFAETDMAIFATPANVSAKFVPLALAAGCLVIDVSSKFRGNGEVPLICAEVNSESLKASDKLISIADQLTLQLAPVLSVIKKQFGIKSVEVATYQAVSGAGQIAMDELWDQTKAVYSQKEVEVQAFPHQIAFNCIPHIDLFSESGFTLEEQRLIAETGRVLGEPAIEINCTCVRVPVFNCNSMSVSLKTVKDISTDEVIRLFQENKSFDVFASSSDYALPTDLSGRNEIAVGRIRKSAVCSNALNFWLVCDNLRLAALNAVIAAETTLGQFS